jgi:hypothetical protein
MESCKHFSSFDDDVKYPVGREVDLGYLLYRMYGTGERPTESGQDVGEDKIGELFFGIIWE